MSDAGDILGRVPPKSQEGNTVTHYQQRKLEVFAASIAAKKVDSTRHKCFISYHADDTQEVVDFVD